MPPKTELSEEELRQFAGSPRTASRPFSDRLLEQLTSPGFERARFWEVAYNQPTHGDIVVLTACYPSATGGRLGYKLNYDDYLSSTRRPGSDAHRPVVVCSASFPVSDDTPGWVSYRTPLMTTRLTASHNDASRATLASLAAERGLRARR